MIQNEYGNVVTPDDMLEIITERWRDTPPSEEYIRSSDYAMPGPNNLLRHPVDGRFCIGHGEGTWDLMLGEFS